MTQLLLLNDIATYASAAGFWAAVSFPAVTAFYWPWWQHLWGVTIVALDVTIAIALLPTVLHREFGVAVGPGLLWVEDIALCLVPVIIVWRAVLTLMTQRRGRRKQ